MFEYEPDLLTGKQAQELLHVNKKTISINDGYLPAMIIANGYRILIDDLPLITDTPFTYPLRKYG